MIVGRHTSHSTSKITARDCVLVLLGGGSAKEGRLGGSVATEAISDSTLILTYHRVTVRIKLLMQSHK